MADIHIREKSLKTLTQNCAAIYCRNRRLNLVPGFAVDPGCSFTAAWQAVKAQLFSSLR
jgi:hypothetical protein